MMPKVIGGFALTLASAVALAADLTELNLASECTTDPISASGRGHTCFADNPTCQTAPTNYVIAQNTVRAHATSWNGALMGDLGRSCPISFSDEVEVIPESQILQPKTVCVRAVAESGSGARRAGKRGWSKCTVTGTMTKYR